MSRPCRDFPPELDSPEQPSDNQSEKLLRLAEGTSGRMRETELQGQISSRTVFRKGLTQRRMVLFDRKPEVSSEVREKHLIRLTTKAPLTFTDKGLRKNGRDIPVKLGCFGHNLVLKG